MSEHTATSSGNGGARLAAHERMSTGALARWARACATHPWRVLGSWLGIIAVLIGLVATIGGGLRDEFEIPGSDTQRATDLIESEFASEQGGVLNIVFAAPEGERLDTPERKAAIEQAMAKLRAAPFVAAKRRARRRQAEAVERRRPVQRGRPSRRAGASPTPRRSSTRRSRTRTATRSSPSRMPCATAVEPAGVTVEYNGEAEFPPIEQGTSEPLGLLAAMIVLLIVFRTFVATLIPIMLAIVALATAFLLLFILAGLTDINTVTPILVSMIGLGVGIDYSLFIVTRFRQFLHEGLAPRDAAAEAGASAGRAVLFAGLTVAISVTGLAFFGLDFVTKLGIGSALGVLTTVLIANSLLLAVLALLGHKVDRLKVPFLPRASTTRRRRARRRWSRAGAGSSRGTRGSSSRSLLVSGIAPRGDLRARPPRRRRPGHAAQGADEPPRVRPARRGLRARLQRPDPDRRRRATATSRRRSGSTRTCRA